MGCDLRGCNFLLFIVCSVDLDMHRNGSFSHHVKFYSFTIPAEWFVLMVSTLCLLVTYECFCDETLEHHIIEKPSLAI